MLLGDEDALPPRVLHPIFYGSFDWHSCVHGWWTLLTLRRLFPEIPKRRRSPNWPTQASRPARSRWSCAYLDRPMSAGFERPYGWGWLLYLHLEASRHEDKLWAIELEPLARAFAERLHIYLAKLTYPIRVGTHFNTAFALILALEWAEQFDPSLGQRDPRMGSGEVRRRPRLPGVGAGRRRIPLARADRGAVHGAGVAAGAVRQLVRGLPAAHCTTCSPRPCSRPPRSATAATARSRTSTGSTSAVPGAGARSRRFCPNGNPASPMAAAEEHLAAAMPHVAGDYMGEHWLASFALLAMLGSRS